MNQIAPEEILDVSDRVHLLKRLSLTFGSEDPDADYSTQKNVVIREFVDNGTDQVLSGRASRVRVHFRADRSVEVTNDGTPINTGVTKDSQGRTVSQMYLAMGVIRSGSKLTTDSSRRSTGLNGVGASSGVQVSLRADICAFHSDKIFMLSFKEGVPGFFDGNNGPNDKFTPLEDLSQLKVIPDNRSLAEKKAFPTGTSVRVWLDDKVFSSELPYSEQEIIQRFKHTAYLVPQLHGYVVNELNMVPDGDKMVPESLYFNFPDGLNEYLEDTTDGEAITEPIIIRTKAPYIERNAPVTVDGTTTQYMDLEREVEIEVAFNYSAGYDYNMRSFVNTVNTQLGGSHQKAFENSLASTFSERFGTMRGLVPKGTTLPKIEDFQKGLNAIVSVYLPEPPFKGQTKDLMESVVIQNAIVKALKPEFNDWIANPANKEALRTIGEKVVAESTRRQKEQKQKEQSRLKEQIQSSQLPLKLLDCRYAGKEGSELFITEGDSALGSMKPARYADYQALYPIKGVAKNSYKNSEAKMLEDKEIQELITIIGAGFGSTFDPDKARYSRYILATDADPDGGGIAVSMLGFFWTYMRPLVTEGRLYIAETPLFVITHGKGKNREVTYCLNEEERDEAVAAYRERGIILPKNAIKRMKGLGEMNPADLNKTAMNPETRVLRRLGAPDAESQRRLDSILETTLGKDVERRRKWISESSEDEVDLELID